MKGARGVPRRPRVIRRLVARQRAARRRRRNAVGSVSYFIRGYRFGGHIPAAAPPLPSVEPTPPGPLAAYLEAYTQGPGIWKWTHYLDVYERHLGRFRGKPVGLLEIGVLGGGTLQMWREYLGPDLRMYGIDINPECKSLERDGFEIAIGNQADPAFWRGFLESAPAIDIVIDDGGHQPHQQALTLECVLPAIRPGGVYVCEDIFGAFQPFNSFVDGLSRRLTDLSPRQPAAAALHQHVASVHRYPMVTVIEKPSSCPQEFSAPPHGTEWPASVRDSRLVSPDGTGTPAVPRPAASQ